MTRQMRIADRQVGSGHPCYVVAELSANHNGSYDRAVATIHAAKQAGADAIKLQTYTADTITIDSDRECFQIVEGPWKGRTLHDLYGEASTPWDWHAPLQRVAADLGLDLFSTPFDPSAIDLLERLAVPVYKVASFEVVDLPLLRRIGQTGKPVIMSTGMALLGEIQAAVDALRSGGADSIALLKCTSAYPAPPESMNLRTIAHLSETFDVVAGLSDHTLGSAVAVAAVAVGASIIEKHLTLSRADVGPDSGFSMEPHEFETMVRDIRIAEMALGRISYTRSDEDLRSVKYRRSLFIVEDVRVGEVLTLRNVRSVRPADGLSPSHLDDILGKVASRDVARGTPLAWDMVHDPGAGRA